jgi:putative ABC transport system permease protein
MRLQKTLKLAFNILVHSKLRSWLTIIGIIIGVAAIVAIVSIGEGAQASVNARLGGLGADIITVSPGFQRAFGGFRGGDEGERGSTSSTSAKNLTLRDIQVIKSIEGVAFVNGIVSGRAQMTYLAETSSVSVQGVDTLAWRNIVTTELDSGRYLDPGDANENVIVIGNRIANSVFKQPLVLNRVVTINMVNFAGRSFKIVGILKASGGFGGDDNAVYMPISAARAILDKGNDRLDSITIKVSNPDLATQIANTTNSRLMISRHVTSRTKDFTVTAAVQIQEQIASITQTFTIFLAAIAAVSLIVGAVGIANTMFTAVLEKTKEIGIMKAIGARNFDIMMIFLLNSGLVGLVGGTIGVMLGSGISSLLPSLLARGLVPGVGGQGGLKTVIPVSLLVEAITISILIGMIAGVIPAYRASKLRPVEALRYE